MGELVAKVMARPYVAHLLRAVDRFSGRLGNQFAAAITYFSVLAIVPMLMFAFASLGLVIEVVRPSLITDVTAYVAEKLQSTSGAEKIVALVTETLKNWRALTVVAILSAAYAGVGWVGNLRQAVDAMWRPSFDVRPDGGGPLGALRLMGKNLLVFVGLLVLGAVTVVASQVATASKNLVLGWIGLGQSVAASVLTTVLGLLITFAAGWALFWFVYTVLPTPRRAFREIARGALFGAVGLVALQYLAGTLNSVFSQNKAASIFGPLIVVMLSLNLFATLAMMGAAWTATFTTDDKPAVDPGESDAAMLPLVEHPSIEGTLVSQKVAKRGVTVGLVSGYVLGGAAGIGLGAVIGRIAGAISHRRRRRRTR